MEVDGDCSNTMSEAKLHGPYSHLPQKVPTHRLFHLLQVCSGVLVSLLSGDHQTLLFPLDVTKDDRTADLAFVEEDAGLTVKGRARLQLALVKLLGWELADVCVLPEQKGGAGVSNQGEAGVRVCSTSSGRL